MREIKFRMWGSKKYFYDIRGVMECLSQQMSGLYNHEADGSVFEQYTGLKDKNGREIYEGDIYSSIFYDRPYSSTRRKERKMSLVVWDEYGCGRKEIEKGRGYGCWSGPGSLGQDVEVIGNIHENPELINA